MKGEFLLDSSALYPLLNYVDKVDVSKIHVLSLTFYEVGNAIWKEFYIHKRIKDPFTLSLLFQKFLHKLKVLSDPVSPQPLSFPGSRIGLPCPRGQLTYLTRNPRLGLRLTPTLHLSRRIQPP